MQDTQIGKGASAFPYLRKSIHFHNKFSEDISSQVYGFHVHSTIQINVFILILWNIRLSISENLDGNMLAIL